MFARLKRLIAEFRGELPPDKLAAVQPRVVQPESPALEQARASITFVPSSGFLTDEQQRKSNVIDLAARRRVR